MKEGNSFSGVAAGELAAERRPERLITLQPDVLSDAEHALGNLLQRVHHGLGRARAATGSSLDRLQASLEDLEALLELVFDYVSPVDVEIRTVGANRVAESLATHLRTVVSAEVQVGSCPPLQLALDRRLTSRSFELLARGAGRTYLHRASATRLEVRRDDSGDRVELAVAADLSDSRSVVAGDYEKLALAVATRFIELQGGELRFEPSASAFSCRILLPNVGDADARS